MPFPTFLPQHFVHLTRVPSTLYLSTALCSSALHLSLHLSPFGTTPPPPPSAPPLLPAPPSRSYSKASEGKSMPGFFTTNSEIGDTTTKGQQDVQETERIGTERIWHGRHNSPDLTPSNPYG